MQLSHTFSLSFCKNNYFILFVIDLAPSRKYCTDGFSFKNKWHGSVYGYTDLIQSREKYRHGKLTYRQNA